MLRKFLIALSLLALSLPGLASQAEAADITGPAKVRAGDAVVIGNTRIRLGGIDAPAVDQLCLNNKGERWTCGIAARDELAKYVDGKNWVCHARSIDRRGRTVARCDVGGEDIQKWLVRAGWALAYTRMSHDYEADEKAAREAKAGMWQGAFIAPWDWRVRNKKDHHPRRHQAARRRACDPARFGLGARRALAGLHHQGQRQHRRRVHLSPADQPLVCADQDEDQQGHALVLLGGGSGRCGLPRD
ncbi:endonuclease YncB(thermonuclease family) [Bradyrhizobium sp. F1.13.1]